MEINVSRGLLWLTQDTPAPYVSYATTSANNVQSTQVIFLELVGKVPVPEKAHRNPTLCHPPSHGRNLFSPRSLHPWRHLESMAYINIEPSLGPLCYSLLSVVTQGIAAAPILILISGAYSRATLHQ